MLSSCRLSLALLALCLAGPYLAAGAQDHESDRGTLFARVVDGEDGRPRALQIAIVTYAAPGGDEVTVDLVGAVHIGDAEYYDRLNLQFQNYDALLYELIAPPGTVVPATGEMPESFVSGTQMALRTALGLAFQLEEIDYSAPNFVHADLSPDELQAQMAERGESLYVYFWRAFYASMREASRDPLGLRDLSLLASMVSLGGGDSIKITMAHELANFESVSTVLDGRDGSALIASRNQRAMEVLAGQLRGGASRVGIFYGVAHMPDMERRLRDQLDLEPVATRWVDAWLLVDGENGP